MDPTVPRAAVGPPGFSVRPSPQAVLVAVATAIGVGDLVFILVTGNVTWGWILLVVTAVAVWSASDAFHRRQD